MTQINQDSLLKKISQRLDINILHVDIPHQGMDSQVLLLGDSKGRKYIAKIGGSSQNDIEAYNLVKSKGLTLPVPNIFLTMISQNVSVLVMEYINWPLLEEEIEKNLSHYIPSLINTLKVIHEIRSDKVGSLIDKNESRTWKEYHLSRFNGKDKNFNWKEIIKRDCLDANLITDSIDKYVRAFSKIDTIKGNYSMLHNDYNQRNLFVNPDNKQVVGIIDWGDSIFGDPIYDFSRLRLLLWHYNCTDDVFKKYYKLMRYSAQERELDELYFISRIIEYLSYYSRKVDDFSLPRIKAHQKFLEGLSWD